MYCGKEDTPRIPSKRLLTSNGLEAITSQNHRCENLKFLQGKRCLLR
jgi:hypothetical protein